MATKTKIAKHPEFEGVTSETHPNLVKPDGGWFTQEEKPHAFKADGTPRKYVDPATRLANAGPRRSNEELLASYEKRLVKARERHAKEIAGIEKKIAFFKAGGMRTVDPAKAQAAAKELLAGGMTQEQIDALEAKLRAAKAALKGKSAEEVEALRQAALAEKAAPPPAATSEVPEFLAPHA